MRSEIDPDILNAYLDGELPPPEAQRVTELLAQSSDLRAWILEQEALRDQIRDAFGPIAQLPAPDRLVRAALSAPVSWRWRVKQAFSAISFKILAPAAAMLMAGLVIGINLNPAQDVNMNGGTPIAKGALASALDSQLASAGSSDRIRLGISFRNHAGQDCRTFMDGDQAGLACRAGKDWSVAALIATPPEARGTYRMAGSEMPGAIRRMVMATIDGMPFDATEEKTARDQGWK